MNRRDFLRRSGGAALVVAPAIFVPQYGSWFKQLFARPATPELVKELVHGQAFHDYMMMAQRDLCERLRVAIDEMYIGGHGPLVVPPVEPTGRDAWHMEGSIITRVEVPAMKSDFYYLPKRLPDLVVL